MMRALLLLGLLQIAGPFDRLAAQLTPSSARPDRALQHQLEEAVRGFDGKVGVYVRHLKTNRVAMIDADSAYPTASMIKVPILVATFDAIEQGKLQFTQQLLYTDSLGYEDEDELVYLLKDSSTVRLSWMATLMMSFSDNTAALWLQYLSGTGVVINEWLEQHGFQVTRMNSRTPGRREIWQKYGWGMTSPREMSELVVMIREGRAVSPAASQEMYRHMTRSYWTDVALSQIPPWVQAASKQGFVSRSRSEVVLVNAPHGDYVFSVITKEQADTSGGPDNAGTALIRRVSAILWKHFEPGMPFTPAEGVQKFKP